MDTTQMIQFIFEMWSAVFCIITAIVVISTMKFDKKQALIVLGLLFINAVVNVSEGLAYFYRGNTTTTGYYMVRITNFLVFFFNMLLTYFVLLFLCHICKKNGGTDNRPEKFIATIIIVIDILLLIFSRIFKFYYDFDENNKYYRLDSYYIMLAISEVVMVIVMLITFKNWKYLKTVERIEFLMFEFLPIIALIIQLFSYGISVTTLVNTISILLVFLTYEMEYSSYMIQKEHNLLNQMIGAFTQAIDEKDKYTGGHSSRVAKYSKLIAEKLGYSKDKVEEIYEMALLHDIGKIGIDDAIIRKSDKLTDEEYEIIKSHPLKGSEILGGITEKPQLLIGAKWHHERYDGKGYPDGLKGDAIPIEARIIGIADSYDAMASNRSYRSYLPQNVVRAEVEKNLGTQFDPNIGKVMLEIIDEDKDYVLHE